MTTIRLYEARDFEKVTSLDARVGPYRPEDQPEVEAMWERAAKAPRPADRWGPTKAGYELGDAIEQEYAAFWVATVDTDSGYEVKGMIGVQAFHDAPEVGDIAVAPDWLARADVAELKHLRVAEESRRQGIGAALVRTVIDWSRDHSYGLLVLNTSTPQFPARALYNRMGFREAGLTYLAGRYEVVWYERVISNK